MKRFFVSPEELPAETVTIRGPEAHHIKNVLRLKCAQTVTVFDGSGIEYLGTISSIGDGAVTIRLGQQQTVETTELHISIGQALLKAGKMDFVVQKTTELGASVVYPFTSERSVSTVSAKQMHPKKVRWEKIAVEAAKQCRRSLLPIIHEVQPLASLLTAVRDCDLKVILWEEVSDNNLRAVLSRVPRPKAICALIGPEGGFAGHEVQAALGAGFVPVGLGRRILRAETATIAILSIVQYELGSGEPAGL